MEWKKVSFFSHDIWVLRKIKGSWEWMNEQINEKWHNCPINMYIKLAAEQPLLIIEKCPLTQWLEDDDYVIYLLVLCVFIYVSRWICLRWTSPPNTLHWKIFFSSTIKVALINWPVGVSTAVGDSRTVFVFHTSTTEIFVVGTILQFVPCRGFHTVCLLKVCSAGKGMPFAPSMRGTSVTSAVINVILRGRQGQ